MFEMTSLATVHALASMIGASAWNWLEPAQRGVAILKNSMTANHQLLLGVVLPLQSSGIVPDGCSVPETWQPLIDFISSTTQLLFIIGVAVLMLGYVVSGLYWIVAGPDGKRRAIEWVKHVTIGGLILVLSRPAASYIIQSFSMIPCGGG